MELSIIFVLAFVIYGSILRGAWLFDDIASVLVHKKVVKGDWKIWGLWRAPVIASYALNVKIWGAPYVENKPPDPYTFHVFQVVLHSLNACIVYGLFGLFGFDPFLSLIGALIFTGLPLLTSTVCYMSARSTLMSASFGYGAWFLALSGHPLFALISFVIAFLCKEDGAVYPVTLAVLMLLMGNWFGWLYLAVPMPVGIWRFKQLRLLFTNNGDKGVGRAGFPTSLPPIPNFLTAFTEYTLRFPLWMIGMNQNPDPDIREIKFTNPLLWSALLFLAVIGTIAFYAPIVQIPLVLILVSPLLIYLFIPLPDPVFESRAYGTGFGIAYLFLLGIDLLPVPVAVLALTVLWGTAAFRASKWFSWVTFWTACYKQGSHKKARVLQNLAASYKINGDAETARIYLEKNVELNPKSVTSLCDLADIEARAGRVENAKEWLIKATERCPEYPNAWFGLGNVYKHLQEPEKAKACFAAHAALGGS